MPIPNSHDFVFRSHRWCLPPTIRNLCLPMDLLIIMLPSGNIPLSLALQSSMVSNGLFVHMLKETRVSCNGWLLLVWTYNFIFLGHEDRVLSLTLSPDNSTVASVAGDETIRLWKSFEVDPVKKKAKERLVKSTSSVIHQSIRWFALS